MLGAFTIFSETMSLDLIVWSLFTGIMIAGVVSVYNKRYLGDFVRKLIEEEAFSPECALTLSELGFEKRVLLKRAILKGVAFKSIVYEKDDEVIINDQSALPVYYDELDFEQARFYIPYELKYRAELKYDKKGTHIMLVLFSAIFFLILALLILNFSDEFMTFVNDMFDNK